MTVRSSPSNPKRASKRASKSASKRTSKSALRSALSRTTTTAATEGKPRRPQRVEGSGAPQTEVFSSPPCGDPDHGHGAMPLPPSLDPEAVARAAAMFRAAGDPGRLALLHLLSHGERCVSELAEATGTKLSTLSQQLRLLHGERMVRRRREGKHIFYVLADNHIGELLRAALDHAGEPSLSRSPSRKQSP